MSIKKCKVCGKFKNCECKFEVAIVEIAATQEMIQEEILRSEFGVEKIELSNQDHFENFSEKPNFLMDQYLEAMSEKFVSNDLQVENFESHIIINAVKKFIFIQFDEENSHYHVFTILSSKLTEDMTKNRESAKNVLTLKSLKAALSYTHCHANIK